MSELVYFNPPLATNPPGGQYVDSLHGLPIVNLDASGVPLFSTAAALVDAATNPTVGKVGALPLLSNGTSWDMQRNNQQGTLLASAVRTAQAVSSVQTNFNARGVVLVLNVTVAATGGLTMLIQEQDPVSGTLFQALTSFAQVTTATTQVIKVYPGLATNNTVLSRNWRLVVQVGDASSWTYSVGYCYIV